MKKILIAVKRVVDPNVVVRIKDDGSEVDTQFSKMSINPFDEHAIEEAVKLKESGFDCEIIAVSIGGDKNVDVLRSALAKGCDRAILVNTSRNLEPININLEPINIAKILKHFVEVEKPEIVLLGKLAIDDDSNQTAQMLAGMLNYPQGTFISKLSLKSEQIIEVEREVDYGIQKLEINLPAVLSADLHLNQPRFVKLPQIMQAKKKPLTTIELDSLNLDLPSYVELVQVFDGERKKQCKFINSVDEVIEIIKSQGELA